MITFKCLRVLAPFYLADVCIPVSSAVGRWQLRSADSGALVAPCTMTTIGQQDFAVGPGHMEQPARRTADFITCLLRHLRKNSKIIYSAASASGLSLIGTI